MIDRYSMVVITIPNTKTHKRRVFAISDDDGSNCLPLSRKYMLLRNKHSHISRLLLNYRNCKCNTQPLVVHTIASKPQKVAKFLNLANPALFTGHCYRGTSASLLVDSGSDLVALKRHGGVEAVDGYRGLHRGLNEYQNRIFGKNLGRRPANYLIIFKYMWFFCYIS